jgi:hypothetical protein
MKQRIADVDSRLDRIALFHNVFAALLLLCGVAFLPLVWFGYTAFMEPERVGTEGRLSDHGALTVMLTGAAFSLLSWIHALLVWLAARWIRGRKRRTLVMVVAGANCLAFPVGTALGIYTLMTLERPEVKAEFARENRGALS